MENIKHTQGEWVANPHGANKHQVWCNGTKIAACDNSVQSEIYRQKSEDEMAANAKLIAAAPQLLEALQILLKSHRQLTFQLNNNINDTLIEQKAQQAINKAIGHEQNSN